MLIYQSKEMGLLLKCISTQIVTTPEWPGKQLIITEKSSLIAIFTQAENEGFFYIFNYYVSGLLEGVIDASANNIENVEAGQSKEKLVKDIPQWWSGQYE